MAKRKPRILLLDIEILPDLEAAMPVWTMLGSFPGRTLKADVNSIICFGYMDLLKDKKAHCVNAWDFKGWKKNVNDDYELCKAIYEIVKDYDGVVTQNGKNFDWKFIETRFLLHGLPSLPKLHHFDTKVAASKNLYFVSNSLKNLTRKLTTEKKLENDGWILWEMVRKRDPKAMKEMVAYCKQDVVSLKELFLKLRKYAKSHNSIPNFNLFREDAAECCPACGGFDFKSEGHRHTTVASYRRLACQDCGTQFQGELSKKLPKGTGRNY